MKNNDLIKVIGIAGTLLSIVATLLTSWSSEANMEKIIEEKVNESLSKK